MSRKLTLVPLVVLVVLPTAAKAAPEFLETLLSAYKLSEIGKVGAKSCSVCHVSEEDFSMNVYGKQVKEQLALAKKEAVDESILHAVDAMDADGDGVSNGDELLADSLPEDAAVTPGSSEGAAPAQPKKEGGFIPKNFFHPAMVHFPIGLFIVGLVLDFFGMLGKRRELLFAGWYNLVIAALTGIVGIATGFGAALSMSFPLRGLVLQHLLLATASVFAMWIMVAIRVHRHEQMNYAARTAYYLLAAVAVVTLSYAGHLGGVLVYGG